MKMFEIFKKLFKIGKNTEDTSENDMLMNTITNNDKFQRPYTVTSIEDGDMVYLCLSLMNGKIYHRIPVEKKKILELDHDEEKRVIEEIDKFYKKYSDVIEVFIRCNDMTENFIASMYDVMPSRYVTIHTIDKKIDDFMPMSDLSNIEPHIAGLLMIKLNRTDVIIGRNITGKFFVKIGDEDEINEFENEEDIRVKYKIGVLKFYNGIIDGRVYSAIGDKDMIMSFIKFAKTNFNDDLRFI